VIITVKPVLADVPEQEKNRKCSFLCVHRTSKCVLHFNNSEKLPEWLMTRAFLCIHKIIDKRLMQSDTAVRQTGFGENIEAHFYD
jgi:hypothetical protein